MKNKSLILGFIIFLGLIIILERVVILTNKESNPTLSVFLDNEETTSIPDKNTGYYFDKAVCDNNVTYTWDNTKWGLNLTNLSNKTNCKLYFKTDKVVKNIIESLDTSGNCPTVNGNYIATSSYEVEKSLVCQAPDNYGLTYYYRGNVTNNYVLFANLYFRILRINGDGSIRIVYDGTVAHANGETSPDRIIGRSAFNAKDDDNAYIGYMYGTPDSSTYGKTHANINDSTIKKYIDNWYQTKILTSNDSNYLSDTLFCNNRQTMEENGYSTEKTIYFGLWGLHSLICPQRNDAFTVSDTTYGNGALTYPAGLLTRTEAVLAGGYRGTDQDHFYYLYDGIGSWLATPVDAFNSVSKARNADLTSSGNPYGTGCSTTTCILGVKPVLNLKPGSLQTGDGTINNPYRID